MKFHSLRLCLIAALACATTAALAENPFAGTWKVDQSKSHVTGQTMTFAPEASGAVRLTDATESYSFKLDGSDVTDPAGFTEQWTRLDNDTWRTVTKKGSTVLDTDTFKLGGDGKTLDMSSTGTSPNGEHFDNTEEFARVAPGKGFYGKWKSTKVSNSNPEIAQIDANGDNGIVWHIPEIKASVTLTFDGKEATPTGPTVPDGLTLAATKTGARSFELTEKLKGKVLFKGRYTVSADGNTMTEVGSAPGAPPTKVVFQKS